MRTVLDTRKVAVHFASYAIRKGLYCVSREGEFQTFLGVESPPVHETGISQFLLPAGIVPTRVRESHSATPLR